MKQAASLKNVQLGMLLPGITINTSSTDFAPIKQMQMRRVCGMQLYFSTPLLPGRYLPMARPAANSPMKGKFQAAWALRPFAESLSSGRKLQGTLAELH
jgi:hypothetical protein